MVLSIILTILFFGFSITIHELGHFVVAKLTGTKVNEFSIGMGPSIFHWGKGETKYSLRAFPIGGYVAMEGEEESSDDPRSFTNKPVYKRMLIILSGAFMNVVSGFILVGIIIGSQGAIMSTRVDEAKNDYGYTNPIKENDVIKKVNGINILSASDLQFELSRVPQDQPIDLVVNRGSENIEIKDVGYKKVEQDAQSRALGVVLAKEQVTISNFFIATFSSSLFYGKLVWVSLGDLVTGKVSVSQLSGPVGITKAVGEAGSLGVFSVISLFAFLSINIGLFNLIPFPALDGGQFVFLLIELIFRRPVNRKVQQYINTVGFGLVILLVIAITIKDIVKLF